MLPRLDESSTLCLSRIAQQCRIGGTSQLGATLLPDQSPAFDRNCIARSPHLLRPSAARLLCFRRQLCPICIGVVEKTRTICNEYDRAVSHHPGPACVR